VPTRSFTIDNAARSCGRHTEGGQIQFGTLVATVKDDGALDMRYHHVNRDGELMTGNCRSTPELLPDGRLRLHESWQWTSGDGSRGESIIEEITR